jgi:hypothetical protein
MCNVVIKGGPDENEEENVILYRCCVFCCSQWIKCDKRELAKYKQYGLIFSHQVKYKYVGKMKKQHIFFR